MANPRHSNPILPFQRAWAELPLELLYTPITHKEKLAIKTMEAIPEILQQANLLALDHPVSPTMYFSPSQLPLQDRMALIFSRVLARARMEADNGAWSFEAANGELSANATAGTTTQNDTATTARVSQQAKKDSGLKPRDVMTNIEAEAFLANIEVVHVDVNGETKWFRRYYRVTKPGEQRQEGVGAVRATVPKILPGFVMPSKAQKMEKHENDERALIADLELGPGGIAVGGWWNDKLLEHEVAALGVPPSRRTGKWAPIPLRLVKNSR